MADWCLKITLDAWFFYRTERRGGEEVKSKDHLSCTIRGYLFFFFFFSAAIHRWWESDCLPVSWKKPFSFNIQTEGQGSLTKAMTSSSQRNTSSMESKLAPPCYSSFDLHLPCLGPVSCSFSSWVSSGCTSLAGVAAESWWLQHPLFTDVTGDIFNLCQIFTGNFHIPILQP